MKLFTFATSPYARNGFVDLVTREFKAYKMMFPPHASQDIEFFMDDTEVPG
jgi:hypothetical protein